MNVEEGDRIRVKKGDLTYIGIVMPSSTDNLVLKLDSGYNIGLRSENVEIQVIDKGKEHVKRQTKLEQAKDSPLITILSTGGTIASRVDYRTGAVTSRFTADEILAAIPELRPIARFDAKVVYNVMSENMKPEYWKVLARETYNEIKKGADGILVTHGTDTMGYTAAALSFMLRSPVPVVLTGSQRSADRPSSDNVMNAVCATKVATSDIAEVSVVMHATTSDNFCYIHRGTRVRKMHASARDAFESINARPVGKIDYSSLDIETYEGYTSRNESELELRDHLETKCALIKPYPGVSPEILEYFMSENYRGIVIEGTGLGHAPSDWVPYISRATRDGMVIVMTSQCLHGRTCDRVYDTGRDLLRAGVIEGEDMLPETALVKLMWTLGKFEGDEAREVMRTNIAGETS